MPQSRQKRRLSSLTTRIVLLVVGATAMSAIAVSVLSVHSTHESQAQAVERRLAPIAEQEYDNLYILSIPWYGKVKTLQLKYGTPYGL